MRLLIIGASGFIGRHLMRRLGARPDCAVTGAFHSRPPEPDGNAWLPADVTDPASLAAAFRLARPDAVVHLAALADVATAEREPERAAAVNAAGTAAVARRCEEHGARLVFVSTEYVFSGQRGYYREDEPPAPATQYGRAKRDGELAVARQCSRWSVLRTSIVYGWPQPGRRNFAPGLVDRLRRGQPYQAPTDVYRTPVYVESLVDGIERLATGDFQGIYHVAGRDWVSMYDFGVAIADAFGLDRRLVVPDADDLRPPDMLGLDCTGTMELLGMEQPGLIKGLAAMRGSTPGAT